jgi:hypothetical protein
MSEQNKPVENNAETQQPAPDLTVQDLASLRQIIDVASTRGAFKANEMATVGMSYNKLDQFLNHVAAQQEAQATPEKQES